MTNSERAEIEQVLKIYTDRVNIVIELLEIYSGRVNDIFRQVTESTLEERRTVVKELWGKAVDAVNDIIQGKGTMGEYKKILDSWAELQLEVIKAAMPVPKRQYKSRLTKKQEKFIEKYTKGHSAAKAARMAGYSPRTARQIGYELLRKPHIARLLLIELNKLA